MTMLDRMRRHRGWLKWSLGIVVVTFVALYIPSCFLSDMGVSGAPTGSIATVNGRKILTGTFQRAYSQQATQLVLERGRPDVQCLQPGQALLRRQLQRLVEELVQLRPCGAIYCKTHAKIPHASTGQLCTVSRYLFSRRVGTAERSSRGP